MGKEALLKVKDEQVDKSCKEKTKRLIKYFEVNFPLGKLQIVNQSTNQNGNYFYFLPVK